MLWRYVMKKLLSVALFLTVFVVSLAFSNDATSPSGFWKSIDDKTKKAKSVIQITQTNGVLRGKILKLLNREGKDPNPKCTECTGAKKNKNIIGLEILYGLKQDGDEWSGGKILDPDNGKEYKCYVEVRKSGKMLKVRGYIGFSLLGRTQYWHRVKNPDLVSK